VTGASTANFYYDADGKQVKTVVNGVTTYYVGNHYEVKNSVVTKYYFAGATRLAVRTNGTLSYLLGDHIGSSSVTTDANGVKTASALYKAFGETRFSSGNLGTDYKFTGQREEASLGIYYFNARWFDPSLGRFTSPDSIVPTSTQGTQAWDRYAFVNNNPVRYNDPTGHIAHDNDGVVTCEDDNAENKGAKGQCTYPAPTIDPSSVDDASNPDPQVNIKDVIVDVLIVAAIAVAVVGIALAIAAIAGYAVIGIVSIFAFDAAEVAIATATTATVLPVANGLGIGAGLAFGIADGLKLVADGINDLTNP
jgi:RHS repeat-associated protein